MESAIQLKHLLSRLGFGVGPASLSLFRQNDLESMISYLMEGADKVTAVSAPRYAEGDFEPGKFQSMSQAEKNQFLMTDEDHLDALRDRWLDSMISNTSGALMEKMTLFWHGHFACVCRTSRSASSYLNTIRKHALGNFGEMLLAIAREPAMIRFLNNQQNRKASPNENFARELLELFTMGEGHYSESDVRAAARAFTGWSSDFQDLFVFRHRQHDYGDKTFLGRTGNFNGDDIIKILLEHPRTATFVAERIFRYFVSHSIQPEYVNELADVLRRNDYEILPMLKFLMRSEWFYNEEYVGNRIKSPIELLVHVSQLFSSSYHNNRDRSFLQRSLGQLLFHPPNVAGWPGGKTWIDNASLMIRLNLPSYLVLGTRMDHTAARSLKSEGPGKAVQFLDLDCNLDKLLGYFRSLPYRHLETALKQSLLVKEMGPSLTDNREWRQPDYLSTLLIRITSLPEFQVG